MMLKNGRVYTSATQEVVADEVSYAADHEGIDLLELRFSPGYMAGGVEEANGSAANNSTSQEGQREYPSSWDDYMRAILDGCAMGSRGRR